MRETALSFGEQRIYASHNSIMFSRKWCYFFVRPKRQFLEVCVFLGRTLKAPQVRRTTAASRPRVAHIVHVKHRDEVESPLTDWLQEAFEVTDTLKAKPKAKVSTARRSAKPSKSIKKKPSTTPKKRATRRKSAANRRNR